MKKSTHVKKIRQLVDKQHTVYNKICDTTIIVAQKLHATVSHGKDAMTKQEIKMLSHWLDQYDEVLTLLDVHVTQITEQKKRLDKVIATARPKTLKLKHMLSKEI